MQLNPKSPIPLYRQLADLLLSDIRSGVYGSGNRIPAELTLAKDYGIGRPTVRQATDYLLRKGILERRRGSGTFVREPEKEVDLFSLAGSLSAFQKEGVPVERKILQPVRLVDVPESEAHPFGGKSAWFFTRVSRVDGMPVLVEDIFLHAILFKGIHRFDLAGNSLSGISEEVFHILPTHGQQTFRVIYPDENIANLLNVATDRPVLEVRRRLHFDAMKDIIYSKLFCLTEQFVFSQTIGGLNHEGSRILR